MRKLIFLFFGFSALFVSAQSNNTLYNMSSLPQRLLINPANKPDCKWYFGTPALSSTGLDFSSNGLQLREFNNAFTLDANGESYTLDIAKLSNILAKETYINFDVNQEWVNFGFRLGNNMFFANVSEKVKTRTVIPGDLFKLAFEGNGSENLGYEFAFNFGFDILHTREYALGYNRNLLNDRLTIGGKLKYVQGLNILNTAKNDLTFLTDPETYNYTLSADIEVNASSPFLNNTDNLNVRNMILGSPSNAGWGIDLGGSFDITKRLNVSASVVDLGQIVWKQDVINYTSKNPGATFEFRGLDAKDFFNDSIDYEESFANLGDSIITVFELDSSNNSFTTGLLGKFYAGANYSVLKNHNAGILLYGSFYNRQLYPAATLSWNSKFGRILGLSVSYTIARGNFANAGMGLSLNMGPEQFYFVSDNLIGAGIGNYKNVGVRFGWNHTFGRKKLAKNDEK